MNQNFSAAPNTAAQRVLLLQGVLLLTWTIYALFLPPLAQQAGISKSLIIWILIADQIVFVVMDWIAGVYADRLADVASRIGPVLNVAGVITAVMFAAMPWIASWANPTLFIVFVSIWAASSSFLRVPAFSLLGRMSGNSSKSGAVSWALFGVCMASAVGPLLTSALVKLDPAIPMLVAALVLAIATAVVSRAEPDQRGFMATPKIVATATATTPTTSMGQSLHLALFVLLASLGTQLHTQLVPMKASQLTEMIAALWGPIFWSGFALGLMLGPTLWRRPDTRAVAVGTVVIGAFAIFLAPRSSDSMAFALLQIAAGVTWAIVFSSALTMAMLRTGGGWASPVGLVFSAIAAAAAIRLTLTAIGFNWAAFATPMSVACWIACAGLMLLHPWLHGERTHDIRRRSVDSA